MFSELGQTHNQPINILLTMAARFTQSVNNIPPEEITSTPVAHPHHDVFSFLRAHLDASSPYMDSRIITGEVVECVTLVVAHYSSYCMLHPAESSLTIRNSQTWTPSTPEELGWKDYFYRITKYLLERMAYHLRIREIECLEGVLLFERFVQRAQQHFAITKESFAMTFTVSMILSNKLNADTPFSNRSWSEVFAINLADLCDSECFFLQHVSDQLHMSGDDIREVMSVCEDAHTNE